MTIIIVIIIKRIMGIGFCSGSVHSPTSSFSWSNFSLEVLVLQYYMEEEILQG